MQWLASLHRFCDVICRSLGEATARSSRAKIPQAFRVLDRRSAKAGDRKKHRRTASSCMTACASLDGLRASAFRPAQP